MKVVRRLSDGKILSFDSPVDAGDYPEGDVVEAEAAEGAEQIEIDMTPQEFVDACLESQAGGDNVGEMFLHSTVEAASKSTKTTNKGVEVGHMAVESHIPIRDSIKNRILASRKRTGRPENAPVSLDELEMLDVG